MTDPIQEGQAFAAMLGKGRAQEPEQPPAPEPDQEQEPDQDEDALISALREHGKGWQAAFVETLHPAKPRKEQEE